MRLPFLQKLRSTTELYLSRAVSATSQSTCIALDKEGDVFELGPVGSGVLYNGWFYLAGELVRAGERVTDGRPGLQYFFRSSYRPKALADFGEEVLALEFSTKLLWVISEEPDWPTR